MKYKVVQRFPNFMTGFIAEKAEFESLEELQKVSFVKRWMDNPKFFKLSVSFHTNQHVLMCELNEGKEFWAIGWLYGDSELKNIIPEWEKKDFKNSNTLI